MIPMAHSSSTHGTVDENTTCVGSVDPALLAASTTETFWSLEADATHRHLVPVLVI